MGENSAANDGGGSTDAPGEEAVPVSETTDTGTLSEEEENGASEDGAAETSGLPDGKETAEGEPENALETDLFLEDKIIRTEHYTFTIPAELAESIEVSGETNDEEKYYKIELYDKSLESISMTGTGCFLSFHLEPLVSERMLFHDYHDGEFSLSSIYETASGEQYFVVVSYPLGQHVRL